MGRPDEEAHPSEHPYRLVHCLVLDDGLHGLHRVRGLSVCYSVDSRCMRGRSLPLSQFVSDHGLPSRGASEASLVFTELCSHFRCSRWVASVCYPSYGWRCREGRLEVLISRARQGFALSGHPANLLIGGYISSKVSSAPSVRSSSGLACPTIPLKLIS